MLSPAARRPSLTMIQAGRGLAALLVVLFHATGLFASKSYWDAHILRGLFKFGHSGVEFFFALSGFVMVLVHRSDVSRPRRVYNFLKKRAVRIYPIYWFVTTLVLIMYLTLHNDRSSLWTNSIFLFGRNTEAILAVAWTLFHEVLFYGIFTLVIINKKLGLSFFLIWFSVCSWWIISPPPHYAVSSINIVFGFGMIAALLYKRTPKPVMLLVVSIALFLTIGLEEVYLNLINEQIRALLYGAVSAVGIAAAVSAELRQSILSPRWMTILGDSSYSLYLVHYPVLALAAQLWLATPLRSFPAALAFLFLTAIAVIAGLVTHFLIERRLIALFNR